MLAGKCALLMQYRRSAKYYVRGLCRYGQKAWFFFNVRSTNFQGVYLEPIGVLAFGAKGIELLTCEEVGGSFC